MATVEETTILNEYYNEKVVVSADSLDADDAFVGMDDVVKLAFCSDSAHLSIHTSLSGAENLIKSLQNAVDLLKGGK